MYTQFLNKGNRNYVFLKKTFLVMSITYTFMSAIHWPMEDSKSTPSRVWQAALTGPLYNASSQTFLADSSVQFPFHSTGCNK